MRTIHRYEPSDIKLDSTIHKGIMIGITLATIELNGSTKETVMEDMKSVVANFLNLMSDMQIDMVDREQVPAVFRNGFTEADR